MKIQAIVHPNSKRPKIDKDMFGVFHIYVSEPPLEGRANRAAAESLAGYFKIKKRNVNLVYGNKSRKKLFEVDAKRQALCFSLSANNLEK